MSFTGMDACFFGPNSLWKFTICPNIICLVKIQHASAINFRIEND